MLRKTLLATVCASALMTTTLSALAAPAQEMQSEQGRLEVTPIVTGLEHPWALAFLPDRQGMLVTERPGHLRLVTPDGKLSAPISGVPKVWARGQGGLLSRRLTGVKPIPVPAACRSTPTASCKRTVA